MLVSFTIRALVSLRVFLEPTAVTFDILIGTC